MNKTTRDLLARKLDEIRADIAVAEKARERAVSRLVEISIEIDRLQEEARQVAEDLNDHRSYELG